MTIVINYDSTGLPVYRSSKGIGSTENDLKRARELDALLKRELSALDKKLSIKSGAKANVGHYWELGRILRKIFFESKLVDAHEKHLYWMNASLYVPSVLMAKDRSPHRLHLDYCFRLAAFDKEKAAKLKWGEWEYFFDSAGINKEYRFDIWLDVKMKADFSFLREDVRLLAQCINKLLGKIETKDLADEQLFRCYDAAFYLKEGLKKNSPEKRDIIKATIVLFFPRLGEVIKGTLRPDVFAELVLKQ